jgi:uncharacterized protein (TIGR03118 family)
MRRRLQTRHCFPSLETLEDRCLLASGYLALGLVSNQAGTALIQDPNLIDPWGVSLDPSGGSFWLANKGSAIATLYNGGFGGVPFSKTSLEVNLPAGATGSVFSGSATGFVIHSGATSGQALFLFATENGAIAGWNPSVSAGNNFPSGQTQLAASTPGAVFKGIALATTPLGSFLYATDFHDGTINVFDSNFAPTGSFSDPRNLAGFAPFGIQNIGGKLFVTYARQDAARQNDVPGPGNGFVDVFDTQGNLLQSVGGGVLNSPWGLALAPSDFGDWSGDLLVGNIGDGRINAFDPTTLAFLGTVSDPAGNPITMPGLHGLAFGNGVSSGEKNVLYFSSGPGGGTGGLFGSLQNAAGTVLAAAAAQPTPTEGARFTGAVATFASADDTATADQFQATIAWGDGQTTVGTVTATGTGSFVVAATNTFSKEGSYPTQVQISDTNGHSIQVTGLAFVADGPLSVTGVYPINAPFGGLTFSGPVAFFSDAGGADDVNSYTATTDWGDGVAVPDQVFAHGTTFTVMASHTFAVPGEDAQVITRVQSAGGSTQAADSAALVGSPNQRYMAQVYLDLLGRPVDPTGLDYWTAQMQSQQSPLQIARAIEGSSEYRSNQVQAAYSSLLKRNADPTGLAAAQGFLAAGGTVPEMDAILAGSAEYFANRGGGTNTGFMQALFQDALGRAIEPAALTAYVQALQLGLTRTQAAESVYNSQEYRQNLVQGYYNQLLGRPGSAAEVAAYVQLLNQGVSQETVRATFIGSVEYYAFTQRFSSASPSCMTTPTVTMVTPSSGPGGTTTVTISGTNLSGTSAVYFSALPSTSFSYNSTTGNVTALAPAHGVGRVYVTVSISTDCGTHTSTAYDCGSTGPCDYFTFS